MTQASRCSNLPVISGVSMIRTRIIIIIVALIGIASFYATQISRGRDYKQSILSYAVNPTQQEIKFYWKNKDGKNYANFQNLKAALEKENIKLNFATNGGMYDKSLSPQGLYIENGVTYKSLDSKINGRGNFYLQPNGIFFLTTDNKPAISTTEHFISNETINYATQSGPMLLIEGKINPKFKQNSKNTNIRNGVGILQNGNVLFAMAKEKMNFYDFAFYFKQMGCKNALYLDGYVSRTYLPSKKWEQVDGNFGVIVGVTNNQ